MTELALTRSKAKHPPDKVAVERQRITSKVKKSNKNRRIENMTDWRQQRLAEMDREIAAKNTTKETDVTSIKERMDNLEAKFRQDELRLSEERDPLSQAGNRGDVA